MGPKKQNVTKKKKKKISYCAEMGCLKKGKLYYPTTWKKVHKGAVSNSWKGFRLIQD